MITASVKAAAAAKVALENLLAGNQRFISGERAPREFSLRREKLAETVTDLHQEELARQILTESPMIRATVNEGRLRLVIAKYILGSGEVKIYSSDYWMD